MSADPVDVHAPGLVIEVPIISARRVDAVDEPSYKYTWSQHDSSCSERMLNRITFPELPVYVVTQFALFV